MYLSKGSVGFSSVEHVYTFTIFKNLFFFLIHFTIELNFMSCSSEYVFKKDFPNTQKGTVSIISSYFSYKDDNWFNGTFKGFVRSSMNQKSLSFVSLLSFAVFPQMCLVYISCIFEKLLDLRKTTGSSTVLLNQLFQTLPTSRSQTYTWIMLSGVVVDLDRNLYLDNVVRTGG